MGHSPISQPFTASQARFIGRCSVGGRLHRPLLPARRPTPIVPTHWRLYRPPLPVGNRTALAPTRSRFIRCHAVHALLRHPAVPITNSITATLSQARFIGRCSVGGRLYRPPFRGSRPISTAPIYRQFHHPLFPARRPAPIVPTSWRLYRAPVPILRQFAVVLSQARFIGRCSVGGRLYRPPFPARQPTPISPTHRQLDHPLFPARRPAPIVPTSWRLYRAPVSIGNPTALPLPRSRLIPCHGVHTLLGHLATPVTATPTQARLIGCCSVGGRRLSATGYCPPSLAIQVLPAKGGKRCHA